MIKGDVLLECKHGSKYKNQLCNMPYQQNEAKQHIIISTNAKKAFDKIQQPFCVTTVRSEIERNLLNLINAICKNPL